MTPQIKLWLACAKEPFRDDNKDLETMINEQRKAISSMGKVIEKIENKIWTKYNNKVISNFADVILGIIDGEIK